VKAGFLALALGAVSGLLALPILAVPALLGARPASGIALYGTGLLLLYAVHTGTETALVIARGRRRIALGLIVVIGACAVVGAGLYAYYAGPGRAQLAAAFSAELAGAAGPARASALLAERAAYLDPLRQALARVALLAFLGALSVGYGALRAARAARP
jgi:hypothetical protein